MKEDDDKEFKVNINDFSQKRKRGVSGILRVRNDAEFLEASIDSCIDALDELIIVYNDCTDESPSIIARKASEYKGKIRYFEYKPKIYANNLNFDEYEYIKSQPKDSIHLLSNYYNYALSKVQYEFVIKIDADQIYVSYRLKELCDAYRTSKKCMINPWSFLCFLYFYISLILYKKTSVSLFVLEKYLYKKYKEVLINLITNFKTPVFISGYNVIVKDDKFYSSLGKYNKKGLNILPPYNGVTDHTIFRLTSKTYFSPYEDKKYGCLNSQNFTLIETLNGLRTVFPFGFMWIHLNGMRRNIVQSQMVNFKQYTACYLYINDFIKTKFEKLNVSKDEVIFQRQNRLMYSVFHNASLNENLKIIDFVDNYYITKGDMFYLKQKA